jgi:membrane-associated protease RseP (regulator of RpoE activity)
VGLELLGIVLFALAIGASIALHEIGHLVPAKRFGVRVTEYMVGFGPTLWSRTKGETTYGIKGIPLGGYIRMIGMLPPAPSDPTGTARRMSTGRFAAIVDSARQQSYEEIGPGDQQRLFYKLPVRKRIVIMMGGPLMNLAIAFVLFAIILIGIGLPQPSLQVAAVVACAPSAQNVGGDLQSDGTCIDGETPAARAGLQAGDVITAIGGRSVDDWDSASQLISAQPERTTSIQVLRNDQPLSLPVTITSIERITDDGESQVVGFLGVRPAFTYVSQPWTEVPAFMWDITARSVGALLSLPVRLYELVTQTLIGGEERDINGPVSVVGASRLGGEIVAMEQPVQARVATFLGLIASLNLFLFLFNLIPVLPLDGGHVAGATYEAGRRGVARVRGRPDPGPVDVARLLPVAYVVATVLVGVGIIVIWADLVKPISFG